VVFEKIAEKKDPLPLDCHIKYMFQVRSVIIVTSRSATQIEVNHKSKGRRLECELPEEGIKLRRAIYLYYHNSYA
jgi:hypothetical protein